MIKYMKKQKKELSFPEKKGWKEIRKGVWEIPKETMEAFEKEYMKDMSPEAQRKFFPHLFQDEKFYNIKEVAKMLKVAYLTVYRWIQSGKLTAYKVGKQYRIERADLDNFLEKAKTK